MNHLKMIPLIALLFLSGPSIAEAHTSVVASRTTEDGMISVEYKVFLVALNIDASSQDLVEFRKRTDRDRYESRIVGEARFFCEKRYRGLFNSKPINRSSDTLTIGRGRVFAAVYLFECADMDQETLEQEALIGRIERASDLSEHASKRHFLQLGSRVEEVLDCSEDIAFMVGRPLSFEYCSHASHKEAVSCVARARDLLTGLGNLERPDDLAEAVRWENSRNLGTCILSGYQPEALLCIDQLGWSQKSTLAQAYEKCGIYQDKP